MASDAAAERPLFVHGTPLESPGFLLWRVTTEWQRIIRSVLKPAGLTQAQFVLLAVAAYLTDQTAHTATQTALSEMSGIDPNTVSDTLRRMEGKSWLHRSGAESDGRAKIVVVTAEGMDMLKDVAPRVEEADQQFFAAAGYGKLLNGLLDMSAT